MQANITSEVSISERVKRIENLNLELIRLKLMDKEDGTGWTVKQTLEAEQWYKRFLILCLKYPDQAIVPNKQLDKFWHQHILDTMKYDEDCHYALGFFLHHFPYYGMNGKQDAENLETSFSETLSLFKKEFGEDLSSLAVTFNLSEKDTSAAKCKLCHSKCRCSDCKKAKAEHIKDAKLNYDATALY